MTSISDGLRNGAPPGRGADARAKETSTFTTPRALRLRIGLFGRTNTGKSSFLNLVTGQDTTIVSPVAGTTTDVFEKTMELLPVGPVVISDTGGIDDGTELGAERIARTKKALAGTDVAVLVAASNEWTPFEDSILDECESRKIPVIIAVTKTDLSAPTDEFRALLRRKCPRVLECSCRPPDAGMPASPERERCVSVFIRHLVSVCPDEFLNPPTILGDLLPQDSRVPLVVLVVPIDIEAPKGRLILPQVQTIRDCLDSRAVCAVVRESEYPAFLSRVSGVPDLVVCDSQAVDLVVAATPEGVPCTTFSVLFSRFKGDIVALADGAAVLAALKPGDRVLVAEACSHHAVDDDIGRVKIPRWLRAFAGPDIRIDHANGKDWPANLAEYRLVVHCGACALTRREMLARTESARAAGVAVTNYGIAISALKGVADRVLSPFPGALAAYRRALGALP